MMKLFISGFLVKTITSIDDVVTKVPVIVGITKTREGKVAFAIGNLGAVVVTTLIAAMFASALGDFSMLRYLTSGVIVLLAFAGYFEIFTVKEGKGVTKQIEAAHQHHISAHRFLKLTGIGFLVAFLTLIDDAVAFVPLFSGEFISDTVVVAGIMTATLIQLVLVTYFAEAIQKLKYTREISFAGLMILAVLVFQGII